MGDMVDIEQDFLTDVIAALKADATDLGKEVRILNALRKAIAAIPAAPMGVKVKPLVFTEFREGGCRGVPYPFSYFITQSEKRGQFICLHDGTWHDTLDQAQAHAQTAYQLAALTPQPAPTLADALELPETKALVEAVKTYRAAIYSFDGGGGFGNKLTALKNTEIALDTALAALLNNKTE
jgi:hypothetical protein